MAAGWPRRFLPKRPENCVLLESRTERRSGNISRADVAGQLPHRGARVAGTRARKFAGFSPALRQNARGIERRALPSRSGGRVFRVGFGSRIVCGRTNQLGPHSRCDRSQIDFSSPRPMMDYRATTGPSHVTNINRAVLRKVEG